MDANCLKFCSNLVPSSYINQAQQTWTTKNHIFQHLLEKQKLPDEEWKEELIEEFIYELSQFDSNNLIGNCGAGEREGRVFSHLVARRNFRLSHGVGRSGDVTAVQPKAVGSSILNQLCTKLMLDFLHQVGLKNATSCIIVPMATGMTLLLCFLSLRSLRPKAKYIIWPRIDQKSCFKSMISAGFEPVIIENKLEGDELRTNIEAIRDAVLKLGSENILCIHSTTSCFAPRVPDRLEEIAAICAEHDIPHIVNNAYGLQLSNCVHLLEQAARIGRVDAFVQSCDKNFLVPVGGAVVATFKKNDFLHKVASTYAGRASASPAIDLLMTFLQMGRSGVKKLLTVRKENYSYMKTALVNLVEKHNEKVLKTNHNQISIAITLTSLQQIPRGVAEIGSMLFTRRVSGSRVVPKNVTKTIEGYSFTGYGSHCDNYLCPYLTVAVAVGMSKSECDDFLKRFDKVMSTMLKKLQIPSDIAANLEESKITDEETNS